MAWVESEKRWMDRKERQEVIETLEEYLMAIDPDNMDEDELEEVAAIYNEYERLKRIHRAEVDLLYFAGFLQIPQVVPRNTVLQALFKGEIPPLGKFSHFLHGFHTPKYNILYI